MAVKWLAPSPFLRVSRVAFKITPRLSGTKGAMQASGEYIVEVAADIAEPASSTIAYFRLAHSKINSFFRLRGKKPFAKMSETPELFHTPEHRPFDSESTKPSPTFKSSIDIPGYEIEGIIGRGGMGAVYKGRQVSLDRKVAIKIIASDMDDAGSQFVERFKNEARAMAKLSHPGIVGVYDFGQTASGVLYLVMEYVDGTDVARMIKKKGVLPMEYALAITAHVCDALTYAHERGIIHRDIKPANIMVSSGGVVKVADFGLAKMTAAHEEVALTQSGMAMGTLHYIAPESLTLGVEVDQRADIYAVGVMLYQMLTGKLPHGMFEMPSRQLPDLDQRYDTIIAKAMSEDRATRYQTATELRRDLDGILTHPLEKVKTETGNAFRGSPPQNSPSSLVEMPADGEAPPDLQIERVKNKWVKLLGGVGLGAALVIMAEALMPFSVKHAPKTETRGPAPNRSSIDYMEPSSFRYYHQFSDPGYYIWTRTDELWKSHGPSGKIAEFRKVGRDTVNGVRGSVLRFASGQDYPYEVFVTDKTAKPCKIYWRLGANQWNYRARLEDVDVATPSEVKLTVNPAASEKSGQNNPPDAAIKDKPYENSLGMKFVPVPGTNVLFCIHETRRGDYARYASETKDVDNAWKNQQRDGIPCGFQDDHPVVGVTWEDATDFCAWLSKKDGQRYRLPTDKEWSYAVGLGGIESWTSETTPESLSQKVTTVYPWGGDYPPRSIDRAGNYSDVTWHEKLPKEGYQEGYTDGFVTTAPVMSFKPSKLGIYDLGGNVWEWCSDWYNKEHKAKVLRSPSLGDFGQTHLLASSRHRQPPTFRTYDFGFRCALEVSPGTIPPLATSTSPGAGSAPLQVSKPYQGRVPSVPTTFSVPPRPANVFAGTINSNGLPAEEASEKAVEFTEVIKALETRFEKAKAEKSTGPFESGVKTLNASYLKGLGRALQDEKAAGNRGSVVAIETEINSTTQNGSVPEYDGAASPAVLRRLRGIYRAEVAKLEHARDSSLRSLVQTFEIRLRMMNKELELADRSQERELVSQCRQKLIANVSDFQPAETVLPSMSLRLPGDVTTVWKSANGTQMSAAFVKMQNDTVYLSAPNKPIVWLHLKNLDPESQNEAKYFDRCGIAEGRVAMKWAMVDDPKNKPNTFNNIGSVPVPYRIAQFEVTNAQYAAFLNSVDSGGANTLGLYNQRMSMDAAGGICVDLRAGLGKKYLIRPDMGDKPVNFVSRMDAFRFINWLHNGQDGRKTETGGYALAYVLPSRDKNAAFWLPNEDEWIKGAFFSPKIDGYYMFATQSNDPPVAAISDDRGYIINPGRNVANYDNKVEWNGKAGNVTSVGTAGLGSQSFYGTFDQNGNVLEWTEEGWPYGGGFASEAKSVTNVRGTFMTVSAKDTDERSYIGFRVAGGVRQN